MNKIINTLLITLLCCYASAETITLASTIPLYEQSALNLTEIETDFQLEIVNCLQLLSTGNFVDQNTTITNSILRKYTNGTKQYYLYFEKNDTTAVNSSLQQLEAIIRLESNSLYYLQDFLTLESTADGTATLVSYADYIVSPLANTLTEVATKLSTGFTLFNQTLIANDTNLIAIDENFRKIYGLTGATLSYAASSVSSSQDAFQGYRVFYSSNVGTSDFKFRIGSAVYNSEAKVYFIHNLLEIRLPNYITLN